MLIRLKVYGVLCVWSIRAHQDVECMKSEGRGFGVCFGVHGVCGFRLILKLIRIVWEKGG